MTPLLLRNVAICWPVARRTIRARRRLRNARSCWMPPCCSPVASGAGVQRGRERGVDPHRLVDRAGRREVVAVLLLLEVVQPPPVGDPVARQPDAAEKSAAQAGELEQEERACRRRSGRPRSSRRRRAPWRGRAGRRRSRTRSASSGSASAAAPTSNALRPWLNTLVTTPGLGDPRQVVGLEHPLVVPGDDVARGRELLRGGHRVRQAVDDPVVEADHRQVRLGDGQVLVVARVGDQRLALLGLRAAAADAREVEPVAGLERRRRRAPSVLPIFRCTPSL